MNVVMEPALLHAPLLCMYNELRSLSIPFDAGVPQPPSSSASERAAVYGIVSLLCYTS